MGTGSRRNEFAKARELASKAAVVLQQQLLSQKINFYPKPQNEAEITHDDMPQMLVNNNAHVKIIRTRKRLALGKKVPLNAAQLGAIDTSTKTQELSKKYTGMNFNALKLYHLHKKPCKADEIIAAHNFHPTQQLESSHNTISHLDEGERIDNSPRIKTQQYAQSLATPRQKSIISQYGEVYDRGSDILLYEYSPTSSQGNLLLRIYREESFYSNEKSSRGNLNGDKNHEARTQFVLQPDSSSDELQPAQKKKSHAQSTPRRSDLSIQCLPLEEARQKSQVTKQNKQKIDFPQGNSQRFI